MTDKPSEELEKAIENLEQFRKTEFWNLKDCGVVTDALRAAQAEITTLKERAEKAEAYSKRFKEMSTIEVMCENISVSHHVTEWENRCLKAESQVEALKAELNSSAYREDKAKGERNMAEAELIEARKELEACGKLIGLDYRLEKVKAERDGLLAAMGEKDNGLRIAQDLIIRLSISSASMSGPKVTPQELSKAKRIVALSLSSQVKDFKYNRDTMLATIEGMREALEHWGPSGCGRCGLPDAQCDSSCVDANHLAKILSTTPQDALARLRNEAKAEAFEEAAKMAPGSSSGSSLRREFNRIAIDLRTAEASGKREG